MAGTLFGLGLSQQFDEDGDPLSGCKLYLYQANTSTPVTSFKNFGLTAGQEHTHPIIGDSTGRIPAFWLADGSYRARLTDENDIVQFDEGSVVAMGPSSGVAPPPSVPNEVIFTTGDVKWRAGIETLSSWVKLNGTTIGSAGSGATFASATAQALFEYIWNNFANTICPVANPGGARGASASIDWGANRRIQLLDMRARGPYGVDDMGATAAGRLGGTAFSIGDAITGGSSGGLSSITLSTTQMPDHNHGYTDPTHGHLASFDNIVQVNVQGGAGAGVWAPGAGSQPISVAAHAADITISNAGGGASHENMPPFMLGTWYMKL